MSFCAIDEEDTEKLFVIWDLGRRCTYTCSYCPPHRRNNWSKLATLSELKETADNLVRYSNIYNRYRRKPFGISCSFTGGEPTVNPDFFTFLEYLTDRYPEINRAITTNGFYTERRLEQVMKHTGFSTISYHCESTPEQKAQVRDNMVVMKERGYPFKVNVMFHQEDEYFKECIDLCAWLDGMGATYTPRIIGDEGTVEIGIKSKTVHLYSDWQMDWFKQYWQLKDSKVQKNDSTASDKKNVGQSIGRPCCGGRQLLLHDEITNDITKTRFVTNNNFQGWNCMINWYFLYIHQEVDQVWHHQTCQVDMNGEVKPICRVSTLSEYCDQLEGRIAETGSLPFIRCPKTFCGCGLCVPKSRNDDLALRLFDKHITGIEPRLMEMKTTTDAVRSLKRVVEDFDEENAGAIKA